MDIKPLQPKTGAASEQTNIPVPLDTTKHLIEAANQLLFAGLQCHGPPA